MTDEPVRDHLGHEHADQNAAGAGQNSRAKLQGPCIGEGGDEAAGRHQREARQHGRPRAETRADDAGRQRQKQPGDEIGADEHADLVDVDAERPAQVGGGGSYELILKADARARGEQRDQNDPAIGFQRPSPLARRAW